MPRKPRQAKTIRRPLSTAQLAYLLDDMSLIEDNSSDYVEYTFPDVYGWNHEALWEAHKVEFLPAWIDKHPCTRPAPWWTHETSEPRKRLGGTGTPKHEVLAYAPSFTKGVPCHWITELDIRLHGPKIGTPIDLDDPPQYESEAAYLQRHGLLTPSELRYLECHQGLLEPEIVRLDDEN